MTKTKNHESSVHDIYARRRAVAGVVAGILVSPLLVKGAIDSYHYGYHPADNPPAPTYSQTHPGLNPNIQTPDSDK